MQVFILRVGCSYEVYADLDLMLKHLRTYCDTYADIQIMDRHLLGFRSDEDEVEDDDVEVF